MEANAVRLCCRVRHLPLVALAAAALTLCTAVDVNGYVQIDVIEVIE